MPGYGLLFTLYFILFAMTIPSIFGQSKKIYSSADVAANDTGTTASYKGTKFQSGFGILDYYDYDKISLKESYIKKSSADENTHDLFFALQSNENLIIDTLSKSIKWKGKDFLEVQINGKRLPYDEQHIYYFLKNLKSTDFQGFELSGYAHPVYKSGFNIGIINILK